MQNIKIPIIVIIIVLIFLKEKKELKNKIWKTKNYQLFTKIYKKSIPRVKKKKILSTLFNFTI